MANTTGLAKIEQSLINAFCTNHSCTTLALTRKQKMHVFDRMLPDLVAYGSGTLHIGEITASGYYGKNGKNFHIGATRKLGEAFLKLYIYKKEIATILERLVQYLGPIKVEQVEYHFIVPFGSRFTTDLGYRARIFNDDFVKLTFVPLTAEELAILKEVNDQARKEMEHSK